MKAGNYIDYAGSSWKKITKNGTREKNKMRSKGTEYNNWNKQELQEKQELKE